MNVFVRRRNVSAHHRQAQRAARTARAGPSRARRDSTAASDDRADQERRSGQRRVCVPCETPLRSSAVMRIGLHGASDRGPRRRRRVPRPTTLRPHPGATSCPSRTPAFGRLLASYTLNSIGDYVGLVALALLVYAETRDRAGHGGAVHRDAVPAGVRRPGADRAARSARAAARAAAPLRRRGGHLRGAGAPAPPRSRCPSCSRWRWSTARSCSPPAGSRAASSTRCCSPWGCCGRATACSTSASPISSVGRRGAGRPARGLLRRLGGARGRRRVLRHHRRDPRHLRAPAVRARRAPAVPATASAAASATCAGTALARVLVGGEALALVFFTLIVPIEVVYARETLRDRRGRLRRAAVGVGRRRRARELRLPRRPALLDASGLILASTLAIGVAYLGMSVARELWLACAFSVLGGLGNGVQWVSVMTALQETTPDDLQARVTGLLESVASAMTGVGFLLGGVITALTTPPTAFAVSGLGVLLVVVFLAIAWRGLRPATSHARTEALRGRGLTAPSGGRAGEHDGVGAPVAEAQEAPQDALAREARGEQDALEGRRVGGLGPGTRRACEAAVARAPTRTATPGCGRSRRAISPSASSVAASATASDRPSAARRPAPLPVHEPEPLDTVKTAGTVVPAGMPGSVAASRMQSRSSTRQRRRRATPSASSGSGWATGAARPRRRPAAPSGAGAGGRR